jgi:hypothetical protein
MKALVLAGSVFSLRGGPLMPCTLFRSSDVRVSGFVCTRGRRAGMPCVVCGKPSALLCDSPADGAWPNVKSSSGTCSAPLCGKHATRVAFNRNLCPKHREA